MTLLSAISCQVCWVYSECVISIFRESNSRSIYTIVSTVSTNTPSTNLSISSLNVDRSCVRIKVSFVNVNSCSTVSIIITTLTTIVAIPYNFDTRSNSINRKFLFRTRCIASPIHTCHANSNRVWVIQSSINCKISAESFNSIFFWTNIKCLTLANSISVKHLNCHGIQSWICSATSLIFNTNRCRNVTCKDVVSRGLWVESDLRLSWSSIIN